MLPSLSRLFRVAAPQVTREAPEPAAPKPAPIDAFTADPSAGSRRAAQLHDAAEQGRLLGDAAAHRGDDCPVLPDLDAANDPELAAAMQAGIREGYDAVVREQEDVCFAEGREVGLSGQPALEGPEGADTEIHRAQWAAYQHGLGLGRSEADAFEATRASVVNGGPLPTVDAEASGEVQAAQQAGISRGYDAGTEEVRRASYDAGFAAGLSAGAIDEAPREPGAYSEGLEAGRAERIAREPPGAEDAIAYALNPPPNDARDDQQSPLGGGWAYWCLHLVKNAEEAAGNTGAVSRLSKPTAKAAYDGYAKAGLIQTEGVPPRGALTFYEWGGEGHVGLSLGDGTYAGTSTGTGWTEVRPYTEGGSKYLGWALP